MKHNYSLLLSCIFFLFISCDDEDLKAPVPGFLQIDEISVKTTASIQGSASNNIKDAWVFIDDQLIGVFELPTNIPIQNTGDFNLKIRGGIFNNGLSNNRVIYPFYEFYIKDTTVAPQEQMKLTPVVEYKVDTEFDDPWSGENFESGINFEHNPNSETTFTRNTVDDVKEGAASGLARLESDETFFEAYTPAFSDISRLGVPAYLELDYKCSHDVVISVYTDSRAQQFSVLVLRCQNEWNKIYVDFTPVFSTLSTATNYNIAIGYTKPVGEIGELHVDNIKFLKFQ